MGAASSTAGTSSGASEHGLPPADLVPVRSFRRDAWHFGWATVLGTGLGAVQIFAVPRLLDLQAFGLYRIFVLYTSYIGLAHLGGADGALLRWAGRPADRVAREWRIVLRWLVVWDIIVGASALVVAAVLFGRGHRSSALVVAALGCFIICSHTTGLTAYALQTAHRFKAAGIAVYAPTALLLAALVFRPFRTIGGVLVAAVVAQAITGLVLAQRMWSASRGNDDRVDPALTPGALIVAGAPLMAANLMGGLAQSTDRLLVSWFVPVDQFALYGFAATVFYAASAAGFALSRVTLPHAAGRDPAERSRLLGHVYDVLIVAFAGGLAAYPIFEWIVTLVLPKYVPALPIVRALIPGAILWLSTQVVSGTGFQAAGRVRIQTAVAAVSVVTVALGSGLALALHEPLWIVALMATVGMALAWIVGVVALERVAPIDAPRGSVRFVATAIVLSALAAVVAAAPVHPLIACALYALGASIVVWPALSRLRA